MVSHGIFIVAALIVFIVVVAIIFPWIYKIFTGKSANAACKIFASQFKVSLFLPTIQFRPFVPLCDVIVQV